MPVIFFRTVLFYLITVVSLRLMGKRQIGELEPTELVVTIMISELATLPLQDTSIPVLYAVVPIVILAALEVACSALSLKSDVFRQILSGKYSVLVNKGKLDVKELRKAQLTVDELCEELRQHGALDLSEVRFCILETSGKMSVMLENETKRKSIPVPIIIDGKLVKSNVKKLELSKRDISALLKQGGYDNEKDVFWLSVSDDGITSVRKDSPKC